MSIYTAGNFKHRVGLTVEVPLQKKINVAVECPLCGDVNIRSIASLQDLATVRCTCGTTVHIPERQ